MPGLCAVCGKPARTQYCDWCGEDIGDCCRWNPATRGWAAAKAEARKLKSVFAQLVGKGA